jgi:hypothetical protein
MQGCDTNFQASQAGRSLSINVPVSTSYMRAERAWLRLLTNEVAVAHNTAAYDSHHDLEIDCDVAWGRGLRGFKGQEVSM